MNLSVDHHVDNCPYGGNIYDVWPGTLWALADGTLAAPEPRWKRAKIPTVFPGEPDEGNIEALIQRYAMREGRVPDYVIVVRMKRQVNAEAAWAWMWAPRNRRKKNPPEPVMEDLGYGVLMHPQERA